MGGGEAAERHPQRQRQRHRGTGELQRVGSTSSTIALTGRPLMTSVPRSPRSRCARKLPSRTGSGRSSPIAWVNCGHRLGRGARAEQHQGGIAGNGERQREQQHRGAEQHQHGGRQPRRQEPAHQARAKRSQRHVVAVRQDGGAQPVAIAERMHLVGQPHIGRRSRPSVAAHRCRARARRRCRRCGPPRRTGGRIPRRASVASSTRRPGRR